MLKKIIILVLLIIFAVIFFGTTNPVNLPVPLLMLPIILVFAIGALGSYVFARIFFETKARSHHKTMSVLTGLLLSLLVLFQSTGGIVVTDIIILIPIMVITYVYISRY